MTIYSLGDLSASCTQSGFVAPNATIIGDVRLGKNASIWFNVVVRADNDLIDIGAATNIQDGAVLHTDPGYPLIIENNVTVGHLCMLHGCNIRTGCLIGINSVILNGAEVGDHSLIGANSLITEGKVIPPRSLVVGSPGKVIRTLDDDEAKQLEMNALSYVHRSNLYLELLTANGH